MPPSWLLSVLVSPWLTVSLAGAALPGWVERGPERGHVLDAASGRDRVWVTTRVGVATTATGDWNWRRDSRFPAEVRRLAVAADGTVWAAPAGTLWRVGDRSEQVWRSGGEAAAVDLVTTGSGALLAAIRGEPAGVLRIDGDAPPEWTWREGDPWCLAAHGEQVILGTLDGGAWLSGDGGATFHRWTDGPGATAAISAVAWWRDQPWVATAEGRLFAGADPQAIFPLGEARAVALAPLSSHVLLVMRKERQGLDFLARSDGRSVMPLPPVQREEDPGGVDLTGAWPLADTDAALVGTFRRGPLRYRQGAIRPARTGFRATVVGGALRDRAGRYLVALMGTGVYLSADDGRTWVAQHGRGGPVTDAVAVTQLPEGRFPEGRLPGRWAVVDFEGVAVGGPDGRWQRIAAPASLGSGHHLVDLGVDGEGDWWALDDTGRLWGRTDGDPPEWLDCGPRGGLRFDGEGEGLVLTTPRGFHRVGTCQERWPRIPLPPDGLPQGVSFHPGTCRAAGRWLALPGGLYHRGRRVAPLEPKGSRGVEVAALATQPERALVGLADGRVLLCQEQCTEAALPLGDAPAALGWTGTGLWAAERSGTLLLTGGTSPGPRWSRLGTDPDASVALTSLERPPWSREGTPRAHPGSSEPTRPSPAPGASPQAAPSARPSPQSVPSPPPKLSEPAEAEGPETEGLRRFPGPRPGWLLALGGVAALALLLGVRLLRR